MKTTRIKFKGLSPGLNRVARADGETPAETPIDGGGTGSNLDSIFGSIGSWLNGLGGLIGGIGSAVGASKGTATTSTTTGTGTTIVLPNTETKSNTVAWVIGGVVAIGAIVGLIFLTRKKK